MDDGVTLIAAERKRQVEEKGWTPEHDDGHGDQSLAFAAVVYACPSPKPIGVKRLWPWTDVPPYHEAAVGDTMRERRDARIKVLAKAGALIAAEIDRLLRRNQREDSE